MLTYTQAHSYAHMHTHTTSINASDKLINWASRSWDLRSHTRCLIVNRHVAPTKLKCEHSCWVRDLIPGGKVPTRNLSEPKQLSHTQFAHCPNSIHPWTVEILLCWVYFGTKNIQLHSSVQLALAVANFLLLLYLFLHRLAKMLRIQVTLQVLELIMKFKKAYTLSVF